KQKNKINASVAWSLHRHVSLPPTARNPVAHCRKLSRLYPPLPFPPPPPPPPPFTNASNFPNFRAHTRRRPHTHPATPCSHCPTHYGSARANRRPGGS